MSCIGPESIYLARCCTFLIQSVIFETYPQEMNNKQQILRFLQHSSEQLKLTYQSCLHSIQTLNILDHFHHTSINRLMVKSQTKWKIMALAILSLCSKMHQTKFVHMRELAKLVHPRYRPLELEKLEGEDETAEEKDMSRVSLQEVEDSVKEWEVRVMLWLKWKLAVPLLYDEVLTLAFEWDNHTAFLSDFPLKFQASNPVNHSRYSENHNFLASHICICLYNFNHLIGKHDIQSLSQRVKKISISLFIVLIKKLIRDKVKLNSYILSPRVSLIKMLEDFISNTLRLKLSDLTVEMKQIEQILRKYNNFREQSREKKQKLQKKQTKITKKKITIYRSQKPSEQKQNIGYFVHCKKSKSKKKCHESEQPTQKYKSRSRSKKQKIHPQNTCDVYRDCRRSVDLREESRNGKDVGAVVRANKKKKSNSTKSILSKMIGMRKEKGSEVIDVGAKKEKQKKSHCANKSKISKRSQKSQLNSKLLPSSGQPEEGFCSKSTYWLRSGTLAKTDKKSNQSSVRMKIR